METDPRQAFEAAARAQGYTEVLERSWAPGQVVEEHSHPFDALGLVVAGEMWLTAAGVTRHLWPGDDFELAQGEPHAERYGPQGATYWVARRTRP
jgi:quercetin dioxygenase-like cupin family protein